MKGCLCLKCGNVLGCFDVCHVCNGRSLAVAVDHTVHTQKVSGYLALKSVYPCPTIYGVISKTENYTGPYPAFARPCPPTPVHGGVESRIVENLDELKRVVAETLSAYPTGEVLVVEPIEAAYNTIWLPNMLTIGPGHDGATSGVDTAWIPLLGIEPKAIKGLRDGAGLKDKDTAYIEAVLKRPQADRCGLYTTLLTQLRAGLPITTISPDFIPYPVTVQKIIEVRPKSDLMAWERLLNRDKNVEGVVVYHPGGSLADHYSVHARTYGIPVITSKPCRLGETITPEVPVSEPDVGAVVKGLVVGSIMDLPLEETGAAVKALLVSLHHSAALTGEHGRWLGAAAALMVRLGATALKAEARYVLPHDNKQSREQIYTKVLPFSVSRHQARLSKLIQLFRYGKFTGKNVGGEKWAVCGEETAKLTNAIQTLVMFPTIGNTHSLVRCLNSVVNQAHNTGWWLNKFVGGKVFNSIQEFCVKETSGAGSMLYKIEHTYHTLPAELVSKTINQWQKWKPVSLVPTLKATVIKCSSPNDVPSHIQLNHRAYLTVQLPVLSLAGQDLSPLTISRTKKGFRLMNGSSIVWRESRQ